MHRTRTAFARSSAEPSRRWPSLVVVALGVLVARGAGAGGVPTRPEPATLAMPGWRAETTDNGAHRLVQLADPASACRASLDRWWGSPPTAGGVMVVASRRDVVVGRRHRAALLTTSTFQGAPAVVQVLFLHDARAWVRLALRDCAAPVTDRLLAALQVQFTPLP
jgi:hypothetical protein